MKRLLFALVFVLMFGVSTVFAAPFLICDPQANVDEYVLEINGTETSEFASEVDGSVRYDLAALAEGAFTIKAKAGNIWGWSDWSDPLSDTKALPQTPMGLRVSSE